MVICHLPFGPTVFFTLSNVVMRHDIPDRKNISEEYPHLIFNNLNSRLGVRVSFCFFFHLLSQNILFLHLKISVF